MAPWLDKKENNCNEHPCGIGWTFHGVVEENGVRRSVSSRMYCKTWACPYCGPIKAWRLQQEIAEQVKVHGLYRMLTLTLDPKKVTGDPWKYLQETWRKLREAFRKRYGHSIKFIAVNELQKNGMPHKHVLVGRYIPQKWVKTRWKRCGGGHQVDIRRIKNEDDPARYICKYLTKDILINAPKNTKRYTKSQGIQLRENASEGGWSLNKAELDTLYEQRMGRITSEVRDKGGRLKSFEVAEPVDLKIAAVCNGWPVLRPGLDGLPRNWPRWFDDGEGDDCDGWSTASGYLSQGIEQGTTRWRLLDPGAEEAARRLRKQKRNRGRKGLRGRGVGKAGGPLGVYF